MEARGAGSTGVAETDAAETTGTTATTTKTKTYKNSSNNSEQELQGATRNRGAVVGWRLGNSLIE